MDPFDDISGQDPLKFNVKASPVTTFDGKKLSIPTYDCLPKYFERYGDFNIKIPEPKETKPSEPIFEKRKNLVEAYKPKSYMDLMSDEKCNRQVLEWMRHFQAAKATSAKKSKRARKLKEMKEMPNGQPKNNYSHILLLAGPPGTGKTTLIRTIAKFCGFHTVELNASDDVTTDRNAMILQNQIEFESVFGKKTKPLFVFEELDGSGTIHESILKAITSVSTRPVVVIANDAYAPSLKNIRLIANVVKLPPPNETAFKDRLRRICELEKIDISTQALTEIAEESRFDIRTALNTISFLRTQQPITPEIVRLLPVGIKNSSLTPFDVWTKMFQSKTTYSKAMETLDIFGNTRLVATGIFENMSSFANQDPTKGRVADMLDDLCYADIVGGEAADIAVAACPRLCGVEKIGRNINFPSESISYDANIKRSANILMKMPVFRMNKDIVRFFLNPPTDIIQLIMTRAGDDLRKRFVDFHRAAKISYKKNTFSQYVSVPDVDIIIGINEFNVSSLNKFREVIQHDIESANTSLRDISSFGTRITDKLGKNRRGPIRNFWGEEMDFTQTQETQVVDNGLKYTYNEGFTNAVRRKVPFSRIMLP